MRCKRRSSIDKRRQQSEGKNCFQFMNKMLSLFLATWEILKQDKNEEESKKVFKYLSQLSIISHESFEFHKRKVFFSPEPRWDVFLMVKR
jgi:hypothetical protein